ncbi:MAG: DUF58 domain-containing protein [Oscillospiraceae bacterium]|nr:DUF58 domain-containing protein [Oscillospiraceae bacterium]
MREFRTFYSVLTGLILIMCFVYQSRMMPLLLLILIICPVISFIVMVVNYVSVGLKAMPAEVVVRKFEEYQIGLAIENHFILPVSPIRIIGDFQSLAEQEADFSKKVMITGVSPFNTTVLGVPFCLPFRGEYNVRIYEVCVYDLLKLFKLSKKVNLNIRVIVLPREKIPHSTEKETETDSESPASKITSHRSNTFNSLREYREGDSIRSIHWKLSAKQDELIVKQQEQSVNNSAVIFSNFSEDFGEDRFMTRRMLDAVIETSLAVTKAVLEEGNSVINCWQGSAGSEKYEMTELSHYSYIHNAFTILPQKPAEKSFSELITLFSPDIQEHHTIYIVTPAVSDELLTMLEETGLAMRGGVGIITFTAVRTNSELSEFIKTQTKMKLIEINDEEAEFYIN